MTEYIRPKRRKFREYYGEDYLRDVNHIVSSIDERAAINDLLCRMFGLSEYANVLWADPIDPSVMLRPVANTLPFITGSEFIFGRAAYTPSFSKWNPKQCVGDSRHYRLVNVIDDNLDALGLTVHTMRCYQSEFTSSGCGYYRGLMREVVNNTKILPIHDLFNRVFVHSNDALARQAVTYHATINKKEKVLDYEQAYYIDILHELILNDTIEHIIPVVFYHRSTGSYIPTVEGVIDYVSSRKHLLITV